MARLCSLATGQSTTVNAVCNALARLGCTVKRRVTLSNQKRSVLYAVYRPDYWAAQDSNAWKMHFERSRVGSSFALGTLE
jgi:hypothetical protein